MPENVETDDLRRRMGDLSPLQRAVLKQLVRHREGAEADCVRPRARPAEPAPLSFGQERLWVLSELGDRGYRYGAAVRLHGALDPAALRIAFGHLVQRHEVLRTVFDEHGRQVVGPPCLPDLPLVDLTARGVVAETELAEALRAVALAPYDLTTGPLLRPALYQVCPDEHVLLFAAHHAVTDGWSAGVLVSEFTAHYEEATAGRPCALADLPVQYADYAIWQRAQLTGEKREHLLDFWRPRLAGITAPRLPWDRVRSQAPNASGATEVRTVSGAPLAALRKVAAREGATPFMIATSALLGVLAMVTGQRDVVIGTMVAGRARPELAGLIGYLANVLPLRIDTAAHPTPTELLRGVRAELLEVLAHQDLPYEVLLDDQHRSGDRQVFTRPVNVLCVGQQPVATVELPGLVTEPVDIALGGAEFDLVVEVSDHGDAWQVVCQFDQDVFERATAATIADHLLDALLGLADEGAAGLVPAVPDPQPLAPDATGVAHRAFEAQVAATPDAVALVHGPRHLTYRTLNAEANRLARLLREGGVGSEDVVALRLERSAESVLSMLAVVKAGGTFICLDPDFPAQYNAAIVRDVQPAFLITSSRLAAAWDGPAWPFPTVVVDQVELGQLSPDDLDLPSHGLQAAYIVHTSGTSAEPKGVIGTHAALVNRCRWAARATPYTLDDSIAVRTPLGVVDAVAEVFAPLLGGARLDIVDTIDGADPTALAAHVETRRNTRMVTVPTLLEPLLTTVPDLGTRFASLRMCTTSGEEPMRSTARRFARTLPGARLFNIWGATEVAADATVAELDPTVAHAVVPIGTAIDGLRVTITRQGSGEPAADLEPGEITVGGVGLARGYYRKPGATAERFMPAATGPVGARQFSAGDIGRRRGSFLEHLGRTDNRMKIRGRNVEPEEIERVLGGLPGILEAVVCAAPGDDGVVELVALLRTDAPIDPAAIRRVLIRQLPAHEIPAQLRVVDALPRTPSRKLDRRALTGGDLRTAREVASETVPRRAASEAVPSSTETAVREVFANLLPDAGGSVGADEDFFQLGGHSVLAVRAVHQLRARTGADLSLRDVIEAPTPRALGERLSAALAAPRTSPFRSTLRLAAGAGGEPFPLTEVQQAYYVGRSADLELGGVSTHGYVEIEAGDLDVARLEQALRRVVDRHPMLRAVIDEDGTQRVLPEVPAYEILCQDLCDRPAAEATIALEATRAAMSHQVLTTDRWPLFDIRASLLSSGTLLHVGIDALICDAHSFGLLLTELDETYRDPSSTRPPLELTFRDYVLARVAERRGPEHDRALAYWRERVPHLPEGPELPTSETRVVSPQFHRRSGWLDAADWRRLKESAARHGLTPSVVLLAAFTATITRWSRRPHYTVMLTYFDRFVPHPQVEEVIGDFTSLVPVEIDHRAPGAFVERARRLQEQLWANLDHASVSGVTVMRDWLRSRGSRPRAVTPVVFTSNLVSDTGSDRPVRHHDSPFGDVVYAVSQTPQVGLDHQVAEVAGALEYSWDAVDAIYPRGLLDDLFAEYDAYLQRLADASPDDWDLVAEPDLPAAQVARRVEVNRTAAPVPDACLHQLVEEMAAAHPDRPALICEGVSLSYAELVDSSRAVAHGLRERGAQPGDLVAVAAPKGWQQAVAALGVLQAGAVLLPLDPDQPAARTRRMLDDSGAGIVLVQRSQRAAAADHEPAQVLVVEDCLVASAGRQDQTGRHAPGDLAYVIYTSGSTGEPKGVMIDHTAVVNTLISVNRRLGVGLEDRVLAVSSLHFDLGIYDLFGSWVAGAAVVMPEHSRRTSAAHWVDLVRKHEVTVWSSVPALAGLLVEHAEQSAAAGALAGLRAVMLSGDWIPVGLPDRLRGVSADCQVLAMGGATEVSIWSVWYQVQQVDPAWRSIPYGWPMDNQSVHVVDDLGRPCPDWVAGELHIGGLGVAQGYWGDEPRTAEKFPAEPLAGIPTNGRRYRTGDVARFLPGGMLEFLGREDGQVKIAGHRIELGEIEAAMSRLPQVRAAVAVVMGESPAHRRLVGYYVPDEPAEADPNELRRHLTQTLPAHAVPSQLVELEQLPLTSNGKVDRGALTVASPPATSPTRQVNGWEGRVSRVWALVLGLDVVVPEDDFFAAGGTSLSAMRLVDRLEADFGVRITLGELYDRPTIAEIAARVAQARPGLGRGAVARTDLVVQGDPVSQYEPFPLTDVQQAYWLGRVATAELGRVATHTYAELDVENLDVARLEEAVRRLVARHEALRTIILPTGVQRVLEHVGEYVVESLDLRGESAESVDRAHERARGELSHRVAAADQWPLFALRAHRVEQHRTRLFISLDLLIADAHSVHVLTSELLRLYENPRLELPALGLTFRDYVLGVEAARGGPERARALRYWRAEAARLPSAPELPQRASPRSVDRPRFERLSTSFDPAVWGALVQRAGSMGVTPSVLVCTVFSDVLRTFSGREDGFTINLTTFNREPVHPDVNDVIGDFTTLTLLAVGPPRPSFVDRARDLQRRLWERLDHRSVSGVEVLRMLREDPARRHDSLMPVVFTSMLMPELAREDLEEPVPWRSETVYAVSQTPQVLLDHQISERDGRLTCTWDYVVQVYPEGFVAAMFETFEQQMHRLTTDDAREDDDDAQHHA